MSDLDRRLASIAARQHQLLTIDDVRRAGGSHHHATTRVDAGRWRRVDHGVYLMASAPMPWEVRLHATVLSSGGIASHFAAGRLWELPGFGRAGPEITVPRGTRYRRPQVRVHESTDLDRCRVLERSGIPVTDPDRTLLDAARFVGVPRLARTVEAARRNELITWSSLIDCLARHARRGRPGVRRLRAVILLGAHREEVTDTDMELLVLGLIREAALPEPALHHRVMDGDRFVAEVDLAYPAWQIAIECDGDVHLLPEVHERDLARQNDLLLCGWTLLRFTFERVRDRPLSVTAEVRDAIARGGRRQPAAAAREDVA